MNWLPDIKAIIFDLDGTMYQHKTFHRSFLKYLIEDTKWEESYDHLLLGMEKVFTNEALFKMGHYYLKDEQHCDTLETVLSFHGIEQVEAHAADFIYGGDAWSILNIFANRLQIPEEQRFKAFNQIRQEMLVGQDPVILSDKLKAAIASLDGIKRKVLMTNTHTESGHEFIEHLQITSLFDEIYLDSKKPLGIQEVIKSLLVREGLHPHEILSIGDHPWNDLLPAKKLGCRTLLISPYELVGKSEWDATVSSSEEMAVVLGEISQKERVS
ncbi:HAD family hydrolase [Bacillus suaedae]|uniref:HAD family hydrolase n=1 Tax=Halalkalibacter suaedae TaxID=2822140 RepID=A0A940WTZ9_9BACI|nr:HAD family hydrolase [Bacillus suaedae]MBP3950193.1 HAD family hydrolase [Bacillus suaedae]